MSAYYFLRIKKDYASSVIEDLQKMDAVELLDADDKSIPEWQKKEVLARLKELNENPQNALNWDTAIKSIRQLTK
jgi:hypothetical protein